MDPETQRLIDRYGLGRAGHSHFSPSSSAGWLNCLGFLLANAGKPDMAGEDAAYGTVAHGVAAHLLRGGDPAVHLGTEQLQDGHTIKVDEDMLFHIQRYIEWCREVEVLGDVFVEQHVDYSIYTPIPRQGGTADHFVCGPGWMVITDLKMGTGVRVFVENNTQAMLYALGVFLEWDWAYGFQTITIRICQPRLDYFGTWKTTRNELLGFGEYVRERAALAWREDAPRSPSPKACQWCADLGCAARSAHLETLIDDALADDEVVYGDEQYSADEMKYHEQQIGGEVRVPSRPDKDGTALLAWRYRHRGMYEKWFRRIGEELLARAQRGENVPGWKIVDGRRSFRWVSEENAAAGLSEAGVPPEKIHTTEIISVAQARKVLKAAGVPGKQVDVMFEGDEHTEALVKTVPGKPTIVPDRDDRVDTRDNDDAAFGC